MSNPFFDHPILNSPYEIPAQHWELDEFGQPTQKVLETRRRADFITPIPKPQKRKKAAGQGGFVFDEGKGLSTSKQQYDPTSIINQVRGHVDTWRALPSPNQWQVTPETTRLLQHWRHHQFGGVRPFFCQVEAAETAIWLTEVAPHAITHAIAFPRSEDISLNPRGSGLPGRPSPMMPPGFGRTHRPDRQVLPSLFVDMITNSFPNIDPDIFRPSVNTTGCCYQPTS